MKIPKLFNFLYTTLLMPISEQPFGIGVLSLTILLCAPSLLANEIIVPSGSILTIQQGVDAATPGDTVIVQPGAYYGYVFIGQEKTDLKLKVAGEPGCVTVWGAGLGGGGITVRADNASVEGFDVSGFSQGIIIDSWPLRVTQGVRITRNIIHDCVVGIGAGSAANAEIALNQVKDTEDGIGIGQSTAMHIHHNEVVDVGSSGIVMSGSSACEVDHNTLLGNVFGIRIRPEDSDLPHGNNHLHHNQANNNTLVGIKLHDGPECQLDHNETNGNGEAGLAVGASPDCVVAFNHAGGNGQYGISVSNSCGSVFDHNSAEGNGEWDLFAPSWTSEPTCNTYLKNQAGTAWPSLSLWDVKLRIKP